MDTEKLIWALGLMTDNVLEHTFLNTGMEWNGLRITHLSDSIIIRNVQSLMEVVNAATTGGLSLQSVFLWFFSLQLQHALSS